MNRENYFIELGLSFDPIENDLNIINQTIEKKRIQWSRGMNHPTKGTENKKKLTEISKIIEVMTDEKLRREEALNAQKYIQSILKDKLEVLAAKGFITNEEIKLISTKYSIEDRYVRKYVNVPIKDMEKREEINVDLPILDNSILNNIENNLKIVNKKDLYDFLSLQKFSPKAILLNKAKEISRNSNMNANKTAEVTAMSTLAGICISIFETEEQKARYDNSLEKLKFKFVDEYIEIATVSGEIHQETVRSIIDQAIKRRIDEKTIKLYIKEYCKKNGIFVNGIDLTYGPTQNNQGTPNQTEKPKSKPTVKPITLGLDMEAIGNTNGNINRGGLATVHEEFMYFRYKGGLYKSNINGSSLTKLSDDAAESINVVGDWIFYKVGRYIYRISTDGTDKEEIYNQYLDRFIVYKGFIYGVNSKDVIKINASNGDITKIFTENILNGAIYVVDGYIYYVEKSLFRPYQLCRRNLNGDDFTVIIKDKNKPNFVGIDRDNKGFYYSLKNENKIQLIDGQERLGELGAVLTIGDLYNEYNYRSVIKDDYFNNISILKGNQRYIENFDIPYEEGTTISHDKTIIVGSNMMLYKLNELQAVYRIRYTDVNNKLVKINLE